MKCAVSLCLLLAGGSVLLADTPNPNPTSKSAPAPASATRPPTTLLEDLVRMTRAGEPNAAILVYAKAHRMELPPELSDATLRWLRDSGVHESVVRYMAAIDVRASGATAPEGVTYADQDRRAGPDYDDEAEDSGANRHAEVYTGLSSNPDSGYGPYGDYGYGYGYPYGYDSFGYGYPYLFSPFPNFFIVERRGFFRNRGHHNHRFDGGGHRRGGIVRGPREAWRDRGAGGRRGGGMAMGPRYSRRPAIARGGFAHGPAGPRGFRGPAMGSRGFAGPSGFGRAPRPASGGGFRGPGRSFGGGRAVAGSPPAGGRGRR